MPPAWLEEMKRFRRLLQTVGGWLFPGDPKPEQPMDRHLFDKWLTVAEQKAASETPRRSLASLSAHVGHGAKAPTVEGRGCGRRVARYGDAPHLLPAA